MFRDEFDPGGVVERVKKNQVYLTFIFDLDVFQLSLCGEKEGKKRRGRGKKEERRKGTKVRKRKLCMRIPFLTFPRSLSTLLYSCRMQQRTTYIHTYMDVLTVPY